MFISNVHLHGRVYMCISAIYSMGMVTYVGMGMGMGSHVGESPHRPLKPEGLKSKLRLAGSGRLA